jgi:hypothetical protein
MRTITIFCLIISLCIGGGCCCLRRILTGYDGPELSQQAEVSNLKTELKDTTGK